MATKYFPYLHLMTVDTEQTKTEENVNTIEWINKQINNLAVVWRGDCVGIVVHEHYCDGRQNKEKSMRR